MQVSGLLAGKGSDVVTVAPDTPVERIAAHLVQHRIGAVVVSADGSAISATRAAAETICPGVQKPHWRASVRTNASTSG